jgi:hypothetical protein
MGTTTPFSCHGRLSQGGCTPATESGGALGQVVNMIVWWNTIYMQAALDQLRADDPLPGLLYHCAPDPIH